MHVELEPVSSSDRDALGELIELYFADLSEFSPFPKDDDGRYGYPGLSAYWQLRTHHPYFIRADGHRAGFVLVKEESHVDGDPNINDIAEFFVHRSFRRRSVGRAAAHLAFAEYPGTWQVRVRESNVVAMDFWKRIVSSFANERFEAAAHKEDNALWKVFQFESEA